MLQQRVILPITVTTKWCPCTVPVLKPNGRVHICVDMGHLHKAVQREIHPIPSMDENLTKPGGSRYSPNSTPTVGYGRFPWMTNQSSSQPFGHTIWTFLFQPFGISSAPEIFQRTTSTWGLGRASLSNGCPQSRSGPVRTWWTRTSSSSLPNRSWPLMTNVSFHDLQWDFLLTSLIALGSAHTYGRQRFVGMVNHLGKSLPTLADLSGSLHQLLCKDSVWVWGEPLKKAFEQIKQALVSWPITI